MGIAALVCGILGGLAAVFGALIAFEVLPDSITDSLIVDWTFWFYAAAVLLLGAIAFSLNKTENID